MTLIEKLVKLAEDLEKEGFIEESDELTNAIENDMNPSSQPILIDKDDSEMHTLVEPQTSTTPAPIQQETQPETTTETKPEPKPEPSVNVDKLEEDLTEGVLALLAKNNEFILGENGEIGNSDSEFVDALMNLVS